MGGVGRLACQGFLVREVYVSVLVRGNGFLLSGFLLSSLSCPLLCPLHWAMECPVMNFAMGLSVRCDFGQPVC